MGNIWVPWTRWSIIFGYFLQFDLFRKAKENAVSHDFLNSPHLYHRTYMKGMLIVVSVHAVHNPVTGKCDSILMIRLFLIFLFVVHKICYWPLYYQSTYNLNPDLRILNYWKCARSNFGPIPCLIMLNFQFVIFLPCFNYD